MDYNIKSIETTYNNRIFRSRLEATWAAFFDLCGWNWEYEPFDLDGWLPDFIIWDKDFPDNKILVEVKPYFFIEEAHFSNEKEIASKITKATDDIVLLLGASPFFDKTIDYSFVGKLISGGEENWYLLDNALFNYRPFEFQPNIYAKVKGKYDFCAQEGCYKLRLCGEHDGDHHLLPVPNHELAELFGRAKRLVRYR